MSYLMIPTEKCELQIKAKVVLSVEQFYHIGTSRAVGPRIKLEEFSPSLSSRVLPFPGFSLLI